jgi:hypothetical protein
MSITPYLAVRAFGSAGLCQPGRVVAGNNFEPIGNAFAGLETPSTVNGLDSTRLVQWGNELFLWQQNRIRHYNAATKDWDIVHTVTDQENTAGFNYHSGLHFMHDGSGKPLLIGLAARESTTGIVRVKYDGTTWTSAVITSSFNMDISRRGIAVFQNQLYRSESSVILRYDPISDLIIQQSFVGGIFGGPYTDIIVFDGRLFHINQGNTGYIHELVGGTWISRRNTNGSNITNLPSFFEKDGNLYYIEGHNLFNSPGNFDGWRLYRFDTITFGVTHLTATVMPPEIAYGGAVTNAPNYYTNTRSHVIVDQDSDPENPRVFLLIGTASGPFNTITAYEFIDETQQLVKLPGGNLTGEMVFPHNNWGSGSQHWTSGELNAQIQTTRAVQDGEEIDFIAYGDPGNPDKKVRIFYDNKEEVPRLSATLLSVTPITSGVSIMTDTRGDYIAGIDADNTTVYSVTRDIDADGAVVGQRQVLMPIIERP